MGRCLAVGKFVLLRQCRSVQFITVIRRCTSSRLKSFRTDFVCPQTLYTKSSAHIGKFDAERVLQLLHSHDQELTLERLVEIRKHSAP